MGLCCNVEEDPKELINNMKDPKELINNMKLKLKATKTKAETKIDEKNKEIEKCKELAKFNLKNGNEEEAKNQIGPKQLNQKIIELLQVQIGIIDDQILELENTEVNQDITGIIDSIDKKIKKIEYDIDNRELAEKAGEILKEENNDLNVLEELKQLEAEVNK